MPVSGRRSSKEECDVSAPALEHLRKQAKELLREQQRQQPESKLADAQHAIAVEYGFTNWPALKARVEALAAQSPFRGTWRMNPANSRRSTENPFERATLHVAVTGDTVTITDVVVDMAGREELKCTGSVGEPLL